MTLVVRSFSEFGRRSCLRVSRKQLRRVQRGHVEALRSRLVRATTAPPREASSAVTRLPLPAITQRINDGMTAMYKRVIVTPVVYPRLLEFLQFDIQSTGQKSHCIRTR